MDEPLAILSDGGEDVAYPTYLPWRPVQRILDWFHIAMRFEHLLQRARGLRQGTQLGRTVHTPCASYREACDRLVTVKARRKRRGYTPLWGGPSR